MYVCMDVFALFEYIRQIPYQFVQILNHGLILFLTLNSGVAIRKRIRNQKHPSKTSDYLLV